MPLFPPSAPVTIVVDGHPLSAYARAYVARGRVFAPIDPLLRRVADRLWFDDGELILQRGGRVVRVRLTPIAPEGLNGTYVAAGPVLRALGAAVHYDGAAHRLVIRLPTRKVVTTPTPFNPAVPSVVPSAVFTPALPATPRPVWTGSPLPARTALPFPPPP